MGMDRVLKKKHGEYANSRPGTDNIRSLLRKKSGDGIIDHEGIGVVAKKLLTKRK